MARRPIALVTALVLLLEAPGIVALNAVMARFLEAQSMSLDGMDPDAMATGTRILGYVSGAALLLCALVALLAGLRDRRPAASAGACSSAARSCTASSARSPSASSAGGPSPS